MDYMQIAEEGNIETLKEIYDMITAQLPFRLISQPATGKVVISHTDPEETANTLLGETIATYCEVEVDGNIGYGCVPGNDPERAKYAALIDAIKWNGHSAAAMIDPFLDKMKDELLYKWKNRRRELCV